MTLKNILVLFSIMFVVLMTAGCAIPFRGGPSQEDLAKADYGPPPTDYEKQIQKWMNDNLKDPFSAKMEEMSLPEKSWWGNLGALLTPREINYGWRVTAKINAKNSFGAYIGWKKYYFYFRGGEIRYTQYEK